MIPVYDIAPFCIAHEVSICNVTKTFVPHAVDSATTSRMQGPHKHQYNADCWTEEMRNGTSYTGQVVHIEKLTDKP